MDGDVFRVEPSQPAGPAGRDHDRPLAGVSERPRQPRHRAGDAGRGPDARPRLAVRAAPVRARAAERHGRRSVSVRSAPHHRHRTAAAARAAARQPRPAVGHGADCRGAGRGRARAGCRRSRPSSAATAGWSSACRGSARRSSGVDVAKPSRPFAVVEPALADSRRAAVAVAGGVIGAGAVLGRRRGGGRIGRRRRRQFLRALDRQRQFRERRERIAADAERPQVGFGQIEHANDVRRQRQDDVGLLAVFVRVAEQAADDRECRSARECRRATGARRRESGRPACWSRRRAAGSIVLISRLPKVGSPPKPVPEMLVTAIFSASVTSSSWCVRGVMSMLTPMFSYWNDVIGCCGVPPVAIGANVRDRHRHAARRTAPAPAMPSEVRSCGLASVRVFVSVLSSR